MDFIFVGGLLLPLGLFILALIISWWLLIKGNASNEKAHTVKFIWYVVAVIIGLVVVLSNFIIGFENAETLYGSVLLMILVVEAADNFRLMDKDK